MTSFRRDRRGNVAIIFALSVTVIVAAIGGAIDFSGATNARRQLQDALDAAVLAGVHASSSQMAAQASSAFAANASTPLKGVPQVYSSQTSPVTLTGSASYTSPTLMLKLVGINSLTVTAISTASMSSGNSPCIYVLDPSGSQALLVNSGAQITAPGCEIDVASKGNPAAIFNSGSNLNFSKVCVGGANVIQNSTTVPRLVTGCTTTADPYAGTLPTPASSSCTYSNGNYNTATVSLSPGVYCGWFNFNNSSAKVTFAPGVYVIKGGGWNVNGGTWTGSGVTFYFADTSLIQFNSGISATLSASTSGTYKNLLFYEAANLSKTNFVFNDSVANKLTGVIWLPSRSVTFNAKSGTQSDALTMVVWRLILDQTTWSLGSSGGSGGTGGQVRLTK